MARDLQESVENLSREMEDWSRLFANAFDTPTKRYNAILDSLASEQSAIRRQRIIDLDSRLASMAKMRRRSQDLFEGMAAMRTNPNAFDRPGQPIALYNAINKYEKKLSDYTHLYGSHGASNVLDHELNRKILSIRNPFEARRLDLIDEYGHDGADRILQAEADVDFNSKLEAARTKSIIEAHKKRQAGFDRGHNAEVRARLGRMHDAKAFRYAMMDTDERNIRTLMDSHRSWNRGQAEQVYFKNLTENTKWLRFIARDNPKIAKNLIPIAKTIGKASGLPIVGSFASNPALAAITAAIGGTSFVLKNADKANEVTKNWRNYENLYGKPTAQQEWNARLAGIKDPAKIAEIYGQLAVNFGGDPDMFLLSQGIALRGMDHKQKQLHAKAFGFTPEMVRLAEIYAGATPEESDIVDARIYALEREESEGWKSGSGFRKTLRSMQLKFLPFQKDLEARGWSWGKILALANPLMFGGQFVGNEIGNAVWDEVHDAAEIDDRYRAGMYDNSTTNNGGDKSVTVIQHINAEVKDSDPVGFVKEMTLLGGRGKHEAESVLQNNDSLRTN